MKKLLSVLAVMAFTMTIATAAESQLQNYVNKKLAPVTKKEQELNAKAEANRKANEAKKAEWQKQQEANKKAAEARQAEYKKQQAQRQANLEKQKKEAEARHQNTKNAIQAEKDYWKSLKK